MEDIYNYLLEFGFKKEEIDKIVNTYPINTLLPLTLLNNIQRNNQLFLESGYSKNNVIKIIISSPSIYGFSSENIKQKIEDLITLGYAKEEIIKMTVSSSKMYELSSENIKQKIEDLITLGYTKEQVLKMTVSSSKIYGYSIENIKQKIEDLIILGYTKEQVIKMTVLLPTLYGLSIENIKQKIADLITLGYTKEQVIKMTAALPSIYGYSIENIKQKTDFYREIGLDFVATEKTKHLMQSVELSYARYNYFKDNGIIINRQNYKYIFNAEKRFINQFGVSKKELLLMYPYKVKEEKENVR